MRALDYFIISSVVVLALLGVFILIDSKSSLKECTKEPLTYGAKLYTKLASSELSCDCAFESFRYSKFILNTSGINYLQEKYNQEIEPYEVNWSNLLQTSDDNIS